MRSRSDRWTAEDVAQYYVRQGLRLPCIETSPHAETPEKGSEPESAFLGRIRRLARQHGWATYHTHRSDKSEPGFPDLVLARESLLFCELKAATGKLTREQAMWLEILRHTGCCEVEIWRPADWPRIVERLTRGTAQREQES